ncbi:MAG: hypothetical protein F4187_02455, partial [Gemmatimonadetes bacterium]|nr:hypothetical protein [Gemmatimonadota bacterium]
MGTPAVSGVSKSGVDSSGGAGAGSLESAQAPPARAAMVKGTMVRRMGGFMQGVLAVVRTGDAHGVQENLFTAVRLLLDYDDPRMVSTPTGRLSLLPRQSQDNRTRSEPASAMPSGARGNPPSTGPPAPIRHAERLDPSIFDFPVEKMRGGYYSDKYFVRARDLLLSRGCGPSVTMQFFQKRDAVVAGTDEAIGMLKLCLTDGYDFGDLDVRSLRDGDRAGPWETVMFVTGPYPAFVHLETLCAGVLGRRTRIATNTRAVVEAAWPRPIMFFPARHDHWRVQTGDGWAAHVAGAIGVSTDAQASWWGSSGIGTVPHGLIAAYGGDTVAATLALADSLADDVRIVSLVDFDNDSVGTS